VTQTCAEEPYCGIEWSERHLLAAVDEIHTPALRQDVKLVGVSNQRWFFA
jgi:hypothetical protein